MCCSAERLGHGCAIFKAACGVNFVNETQSYDFVGHLGGTHSMADSATPHQAMTLYREEKRLIMFHAPLAIQAEQLILEH